MIVDNHITLRFRTNVPYSSKGERDRILKYLDELPIKVHAYDHTHNLIIADFLSPEQQENALKGIPGVQPAEV